MSAPMLHTPPDPPTTRSESSASAGLVVCAWCRRPLGRTPLARGLVSHTICRPCSDDFLHAPDHDWPRSR